MPRVACNPVVMQQNSLAHHLRVVAAHYEASSKDKALANQPRLREQFRQQQAECLLWATTLDNAERLRVDGDQIIVDAS